MTEPNVEVRISYSSNYAHSFFRCRLMVDGQVIYVWENSSRRRAERAARRMIKKYNKGWRPKPDPPAEWTVRL